MQTRPPTGRPHVPGTNGFTMPWPYFAPPEAAIATPFDPEPLALLLDDQWAAWPALAQALRRCTMQWGSVGCTTLLDPASPESAAAHKAFIMLHCPQRGRIRVEVLETGAIAELDFFDHFENDYSEPMVQIAWNEVPPFTVVHRSWDPAGS